MSPLASVVRSTRVQAYLKVDNNTPVALFHQKFWGKSMEDEKAKWQETQIESQPEDEDQDKHKAMEKGKGKAMDEGGDEVMNEGEGKPDEDEGEATDQDDDILPDCYVLDISIDDMPTSLWIRAEYIRIFDCFQAHFDKYTKPEPKGKTPSAVLTGQPGIGESQVSLHQHSTQACLQGKSFWIYYAARRLLAEKSPFIWFYQSEYYLFVDDGVYSLPPYWEHADFTSIIWTLVDSDQDRDGPPGTLVPHGTLLFVTWSRLDKTTRPIVVFMNPWGRKEIQRAACLSPLEGITETHVDEIFDELGPVARLCVDKEPNELARYRIELQEAITKITTGDIKKLIDEASGLTMDAVSQKIFLLRRQQRDDIHSRAVVAPITDSIKSRLSNQFRHLQRAELVHLCQFCEKGPGSMRIAGIFYDAIA
ncbi:hypothetical protein M378DRAFT_178977 [Amanita muscaria Koide BX008]|uniref:Uncharacterized protein n=1 Tax=Amanita muscaria (strain Koide BX008) TaxID=946122 RepID=A0A0C2WR59_AMAMK|nr:hypothetical protein M378DRAFT_178977 [Amanita muscaria Koide BX008]